MKGVIFNISWEKDKYHCSYLHIKNTGDMQARDVHIFAEKFRLFDEECIIEYFQPGQTIDKYFAGPKYYECKQGDSFVLVIRYKEGAGTEEKEVRFTLMPKIK